MIQHVSDPWRRHCCILLFALIAIAPAAGDESGPRFSADPAAPSGYASERAIKKAFDSGELQKTRISFTDLAQVEIHPYLVYDSASHRNVLDLYRPRTLSGDAPVILLIHGGAWDHGDKKSVAAYAMHFATRGYVCAAMNYRLSDQAVYPAAVNDVRSAIEWIRANAAAYHGDPERIALVGYSAGAHLAMLGAYSQQTPPGVRCVVNMYGPTDLAAPSARRMKAVREFLGGSYRAIPERYHHASPMSYVRTGLPPTLIVHGDIDDVVPIEQAETFARALHAHGVQYEYRRLSGWDHAPDRAAPVFRYCAGVMEDFFREVFGR